MDYDLSRIDFTICGITYPNTLKILPASGPKIQQKFAIGDKNGVLQCLSIKDEESVVQFKTLPGKPITSVQLAATVVGAQVDKIFAASGNEVKGYTKKGKVFLAIETPITETITSMCVVGADLILCSGSTVTYYRDLREYYSYVCEDRVLDIAAFASPNSTKVRLLALVANKGAILLEGGKVVTRATIPAGPCRLAVPNTSQSNFVYAFYGAVDGSIGIISYESALSSQCLVEGRGLGAIVCLGWYTGNGGLHLAVGRHDGSIQLYLIDPENFIDKPRLKFTYFCGEPVTSVGGGCVGVAENELLAATFSGRIFALRSRQFISGLAGLAHMSQDALSARRSKLESEIARLEKQVANERDKYQKSTHSLQSGLSSPPLLDVQYEISGATREGWQETRITSAVPLDMLFIYCKKKLDIQTDNVAVLSVCPSQGKESDLLATVRCQAGTRRLWMQMRTVKDVKNERIVESVVVLIYALPAGAPRVARLISLRLPVLPYYSQHEDPDFDKEKRSWCQVRVSGGFSVAEMTSWLTNVLPGQLPRPATNVHFVRRHTLLSTMLISQYQRGAAVFKSDNISTVAVIRDIMSNSSIEKNIRVDITCDVPDDCCLKSFRRIEDEFKTQYEKNKDMKLKTSISSLDLDSTPRDTESPVLCEEYRRVLASPSSEEETNLNFDEFVDIIDQWYADWRSLSIQAGEFSKERIQLREALHVCDIERVTKILTNEPPSPQEYF